MPSRQSIDSDYNALFERDEQLQHSANALSVYRQDHRRNGGSGTRGSGSLSSIKRHIVNVDGVTKLNYEMIKNTPGNFVLRDDAATPIDEEDDPSEEIQFAELDAIKTKCYKSALYAMNDEYLRSLETGAMSRHHTAKSSTHTTPLSPEEQVECLYEIQKNLIHDYRKVCQEEKKWFVLKELLLDANLELDLFSEQERVPSNKAQEPYRITKINLGTINPPNNNTLSAINALSFHRKRKLDTER
ncbi:Ies3p KNAG_0E03360 [Huiozyma naganishii CBS 8797]|uniref:Uncharacterized protein n=1 Tax=Huiozyma naganishii (strain ATCC MYA-139 / BCRC 22969 / CBS 8797 / KCTC 17520 / NBRC 10181 / NCYC 3082 / Yp74L-3) TaxID=1071383 RepID=J7S6V1_HUIN7|nr:hypothetical protein KNAG_0E03360 [Kazachstania naganishii CBS 8797]CCK70594.1 hypothetical protein KNAG_0E03360 [Kazachstania naganishii CBS 8797]